MFDKTMNSTEPDARSGRIKHWILRAGCVSMALVSLASTGCGYSNQSLYRDSVGTVYVEMFQSKEFRRGLEFQLTEALRKEIDSKTPYRNAQKGRADSVLSGEILEWREAAVGKDYITDQAREIAGTLAVRYRWQDVRTGKLLVDRPLTVTTVQYVRLAGEEAYDAYENAVNQMARKIVESMESPW